MNLICPCFSNSDPRVQNNNDVKWWMERENEESRETKTHFVGQNETLGLDKRALSFSRLY